jgi:uncharacterized membrane protein
VLAAPLAGAALGALFGGAVNAGMAAEAGISDEFIRDVESLMRPGTSALFILDDAVDMEVILHTIKGLGGNVLKTNVDPDRAKLIQSTLAQAKSDAGSPHADGPIRIEEDVPCTRPP